MVTFDNLSGGHRDAVLGGEFVLGDLANQIAPDAVFGEPDYVRDYIYACVVDLHFAQLQYLISGDVSVSALSRVNGEGFLCAAGY